ncbi:acyl-CoA dehydrogenase [Streptomyces sp. NPDC056716]|uniref:acyl-CoA dehydrogenase n=1 Tax=unclassified Streptomyces TaxID=2593676 RepID=UPI0036AD53EE
MRGVLTIESWYSMGIALTEDQLAWADAVRGFVKREVSVATTRAEFEDLAAGIWPIVWPSLVRQGFVGMHIDPSAGGDGGTLVDVAVLLEETGRALVPGPLLPTVLASVVLGRHGSESVTETVLPRFVTGATGACVTTAQGLTAVPDGDGWRVSGTTAPLLGAVSGQFLILGAQAADRTVWFVVERPEDTSIKVEQGIGVDLTRDIGRVTLAGLAVRPENVLTASCDDIRTVAAVLFAAEAAGIARYLQESGLAYAKIREQFGRTIGSFQSVKHKCARLYMQTELMTAAAWDAARALQDQPADQAQLAAAAAAVYCFNTIADIGLETTTLFGGIGYTWEHDTHLYWRRGLSLASLLGPARAWDERLGRLAGQNTRRRPLDLGAEPEGFRAEIAGTIAGIAAAPEGLRRAMYAGAGLVSPHYPRPYGRAAGPVQQVIIAEEFARAGITPPSTIIGEWALPTILAHGTEEQREAFIGPTLRGDIVWCQLFSEPGAGSDLASLRTRAEKVDGGWLLNGQKVWTSGAHEADWGICLARTDPDVPKHKGISYFLVDLHAPGLEVRPLREASGAYLFNEVFFDDVFVPDARLVGEPGEGWRLARTTLGNERVSMGSGMAGMRRDPLQVARALGSTGFGEVIGEAGRLQAQREASDALGQRALLRQLTGLQPGPESSVLKLASAWNSAAMSRAAQGWAGPEAAEMGEPYGGAAQGLVSVGPSLIGGGTAEIQLNVIAERVLGLPRD